MISLMVTAWGSVAGELRPAMFMATTLNSIFSPTGRSFTLYWLLSTSSWLACTHSSPEGERGAGLRGRDQEVDWGSGDSYFLLCSTRPRIRRGPRLRFSREGAT